MVGNRLFSGGDRRVFVSDMDTGETLHQITRDTGSIPLLLHHEGGIYCCSSNGAIRVFGLMHNVKRIHLVPPAFLSSLIDLSFPSPQDLTMWEHSKRVTSVIFGERSVGNCDLHGIENHICRMFTASEDRLIRVWDMEIHLPVKTIRTKM
jgi:WD40 repeat protein